MNSSLQLIYVLFMRDFFADYNPGMYISRNRFTNHPSAGKCFLLEAFYIGEWRLWIRCTIERGARRGAWYAM